MHCSGIIVGMCGHANWLHRVLVVRNYKNSSITRKVMLHPAIYGRERELLWNAGKVGRAGKALKAVARLHLRVLNKK